MNAKLICVDNDVRSHGDLLPIRMGADEVKALARLYYRANGLESTVKVLRVYGCGCLNHIDALTDGEKLDLFDLFYDLLGDDNDH